VKTSALLAASLVAASCGGGGSRGTKEPEPPSDPDSIGDYVEPIEDEEDEEPPPPPPPMQWYAKVTLAAVKGSTMKPTVLRFEQTDGEGVRATSDEPLQGLKAGTYHLVFHEGDVCGKNAKSAGAAWAEAGAAITFEVVKGEPAVVDQADLELMLDGELSIVGHALVVHADKKGKADKPLACGVVESAEANMDVEAEERDE
jgi:hypothetical protein